MAPRWTRAGRGARGARARRAGHAALEPQGLCARAVHRMPCCRCAAAALKAHLDGLRARGCRRELVRWTRRVLERVAGWLLVSIQTVGTWVCWWACAVWSWCAGHPGFCAAAYPPGEALCWRVPGGCANTGARKLLQHMRLCVLGAVSAQDAVRVFGRECPLGMRESAAGLSGETIRMREHI